MHSNNKNYIEGLLEAEYRTRGTFQAREVELLRRVRLLRAEVGCEKPPVDVEAMARHLGVAEIRARPIRADGQIRKEDGRLILEVDSRASSERKRFTIAHEIGHLLLAGGGDFGCSTMRDRSFRPARTPDPSEERWCDFIAAEILTPIDWARDFTFRRSPSFRVIREMSKYFETSLSVAARRAVESGMWKCRLIYWQKCTNNFQAVGAYPAYSPSTLAFLKLLNPEGSLVKRAFQTGKLQSGKEELEIEEERQTYEADVWREGEDKAVMLLVFGHRTGAPPVIPPQRSLFQ